jgi:ligand-binding sensor domain-containing protein
MKKILFFKLLILFLFTGIKAQTWTNYRTSNTSSTLPNNMVTCMATEGDDLIWFGTDDGLGNFDGTNWTIFTAENSNLSNNFINGLEVDDQGRIWVAQDDGISIYQDNNFTNIYYEDGLSAYHAECLEFNKVTGDMWIGYGQYSTGITRYDGENFTHYTTADGLGFNKVYTIEADTAGNIWCGFGNNSYGVSVFNGSNWHTYTTSDGLSSNNVYDIHVDDSASIWLATSAGISKYKNSSWSIISKINSVVLSYVFSINQDQDGDLWFGANSKHIYEYTGTAWNNYQIPDFPSTSWFNGIALFKGNMWFATGPGVNEFNGEDWIQHRITDGMETNVIGHIFVASDNSKYCGEYNDLGFSRFKNGEWFLNDETSSITSACEDTSGAIWFGSTFALYKYEGDSMIYYTTADGLSSNNIYDVSIDKNNVLWIATDNGITRYDGADWSTYNTSDGLLNNDVHTIDVDLNGNIWCGYGFNGLGATFFDGGSFTHYTTADGLVNNSVKVIRIDDYGTIWFGTDGGGVSRFDGSIWTSYTTANGLSNNTINSIDIYDTIVWCATNGGISKFDNSTWTKFNESNSGLLENWVWTIAADKYNNVWIGFGSSGFGVQKFGLPEPQLNVISDTIYIGNEEGSTAEFTIYSNTSWEIESSESWLSVSPATGQDTSIITITAQANTLINDRYATLNITASELNDYELIVKQLSGATAIFNQTETKCEFDITLEFNNLSIRTKNDFVHNLEIYNISGKLIFKDEFNNNITVNISQLNEGLYILKIHSKGGTLTSKIVF